MQQLGRTLAAFKQVYVAEVGASPLAAWMLSLLVARDGQTQHELTAQMRVDPSMVTRTVQEMEGEHGWVRRARDPDDNRLVRVYLTESGRTRARGLIERVADMERRLTRGLSAERVGALCATLRELEEAARTEHSRLTARAATPRKDDPT
jgi:DNA-binding MarR family transcriptional regulator